MIDLSEFSISIKNWPTIRKEVFDHIRENASGPVEVEGALKELARKLGVSSSALKQEWQGYVSENGEAGPHSNGAAVKDVLERLRGYGMELWQSTGGEAFISMPVPNPPPSDEFHLEHFRIDSSEFKEWLALFYYQQTGGGILREDGISDAVRALKAQARLGKVYEVFTRLGWKEEESGEDGNDARSSVSRIYLDLNTPDRAVVEIDEDGFRVITAEESPVRFRHLEHRVALPRPVESTDGLFEFLRLFGVEDREVQAKILAWLIGTLLPKGAYPILIIEGEKGAGKSTLAMYLKRLIDPSPAPLLSESKNNEDLAITALTNHVLVFDNLSRVPAALSDSLSRLSTGGGLIKRRLYTDAGAVALYARRPIIITGIELNELRDDLMDRAIRVKLQRINNSKRLTDEEIEERFYEVHPHALGHLLLAASYALRGRVEARERLKTSGKLPRMGTWAAWAEAAGPVLGFDDGEALEAYNTTQSEFYAEVMDINAVARAIKAFYAGIKPGTVVEYSTGELYSAVERAIFPSETQRRPSWWPDTPARFGRLLPRLLEALQRDGVQIERKWNSKHKTYRWVLTKPEGGDDGSGGPGGGPNPGPDGRGPNTPPEHHKDTPQAAKPVEAAKPKEAAKPVEAAKPKEAGGSGAAGEALELKPPLGGEKKRRNKRGAVSSETKPPRRGKGKKQAPKWGPGMEEHNVDKWLKEHELKPLYEDTIEVDLSTPLEYAPLETLGKEDAGAVIIPLFKQ